MNPTMSRAETVSTPITLDFSIPKERRLSLPKAILVALLIEVALIAGLAYLSTKSKKPPEKITQVTEFIPMSMPAPTPPAPVEPPPPKPVEPPPPKPVEPPPPEPPKPEPIKTEPPKPLPKSPIQEPPKPKPVHHEKPKPHKPKPKKVEPPKETPKPTPPPKPVAEKAPPAPPKPAEPAPPKPAQAGASSEAKSVSRVKPDYPRRALNAGIEGWVKLRFTVTADGRVDHVTVVESNPPRLFDRAAVDAVKHWQFKPKMVDGKAVDGQVEQVIQFKLSDQ